MLILKGLKLLILILIAQLSCVSKTVSTGGLPLTFIEVQREGDGGIVGLDGPQMVVLSPDGRHAYAVSSLDNAIVLFRREPSSGQLTFVTAYSESRSDIAGLAGALAIALSPDGQHVYVAGYLDDAIVVFKREPLTGALTFVETLNRQTIEALNGPQALTISPDGRHVYVASVNGDAVVVFERTGAMGRLIFVETQKNGLNGIEGLDGANGVAVSPDGDYVYLTSLHDKALVAFMRNPMTGRLTFLEVYSETLGTGIDLARLASPVVSRDGRNLYLADAVGDAIFVFQRNVKTGLLNLEEVQRNDSAGGVGLDGPQSVTISPDDGHLYAANFSGSSVTVFKRQISDGSLAFIQAQQNDTDGVKGIGSANAVALDPTGKHLYVTGYLDNAVSTFHRNPATGKLSFVDFRQEGEGGLDGLDGIFAVVVSPDGRQIYTASGVDDSVTVFSRQANSGALTFVEGHKDNVAGVDGLDGAISATISPDGRHVYVAAAIDGAIVVFSRDVVSGKLTFLAAYRGNSVAGPPLSLPVSLTISPDGQHLYAADMRNDAIIVFRRDETSGHLAYVEAQKDKVGGVAGLDGPVSLTVSPDGRHVYVAGIYGDAVVVFQRDKETGTLRFLEAKKNGLNGLTGLDRASAVTVSPDGRHVYVTGSAQGVVAAFSRNTRTGALTFLAQYQDGVAGVSGLEGACYVTVGPNGQYVYVAGINDDTIAIFRRHLISGKLTFLDAYQDGLADIDGLDGITSLAVSPDGRHLYAAGINENALAVFATRRAGAK